MGNKTTKQMLIELYREEREQERCAIVHELKKEATFIAKPYLDAMSEVKKKLHTLNDEMDILRQEIRKHEQSRDDDLQEYKLYTFTHKTCGDALHDNLMSFDKETNDHIRSILE